MASDHVTFSLRMPQLEHYEALRRLASLHRVSIAEQARSYILDGMRAALDPDDIERGLEADKQRMLAVAAELNGTTDGTKR